MTNIGELPERFWLYTTASVAFALLMLPWRGGNIRTPLLNGGPSSTLRWTLVLHVVVRIDIDTNHVLIVVDVR